jgi:hypothetical protein
MTQREIVVQIERTEFDTTAIEEYERQRLNANRPRPVVRGEPIVAVHARRYSGLGLIAVVSGLIAVALAVFGASLLAGNRTVLLPLEAVQRERRSVPARDADAVTFHWRVLGGLEVVTVWSYSGEGEGFDTPSGELCFLGLPSTPALPIAANRKPLVIDQFLASRLYIQSQDIEAALPLCSWYEDGPSGRSIEAWASPDAAEILRRLLVSARWEVADESAAPEPYQSTRRLARRRDPSRCSLDRCVINRQFCCILSRRLEATA